MHVPPILKLSIVLQHPTTRSKRQQKAAFLHGSYSSIGFDLDALRRKRSAIDSGNRPSLPSNASPRVESLSNFQTSHCPPCVKPPSEKSAPQQGTGERVRLCNEMEPPSSPPFPQQQPLPIDDGEGSNAAHALTTDRYVIPRMIHTLRLNSGS